MRPSSRPRLPCLVALACTLAGAVAAATGAAPGDEPVAASALEASATLTWDGSVVAGGPHAGRGAGRSLVEVGVAVDLERAFGWRGARAYAGVLGLRGSDGSGLAGEHQAHSNIDAETFETAVAWVERSVAGDRLRIRAGRMDANEEFGVTDAAEPFLNASAGLSPSICGLPSYPRPGDGVVVASRVAEGWEASAGAFRIVGPPDEVGHGTIAVLEGRRTWGSTARRGRVALGLWNHRSPAPEGTPGAGRRDVRGGYAVVERSWSGGARRRPGRAFLQVGHAPHAAVETRGHLAAGAILDGPFARRASDTVGVYATVAEIRRSDPVAVRRETVVEAFYRFRVTDWLAVQPDLQWIPAPGGEAGADDHAIASVRVELAF